jgi:hypothetical protein
MKMLLYSQATASGISSLVVTRRNLIISFSNMKIIRIKEVLQDRHTNRPRTDSEKRKR